jgi:hypothetical protein
MKKMSIKDFMDQAKGNWVSTKTCQVGDTFTITSQPKIDKETFPGKIALVMDVKKESDPNNPMKLRLNGSQVSNIEPTFGGDASKWVGRRVKIVAKQDYAGLGKSGFIYIAI